MGDRVARSLRRIVGQELLVDFDHEALLVNVRNGVLLEDHSIKVHLVEVCDVGIELFYDGFADLVDGLAICLLVIARSG